MSGWLEYVEPCEHDVEWHHETSECWAHDGKHKEQPDCYCQGNQRRRVSIDYEAAAKAIYTRRWGPSMSGAKPGTMDYELAHAAVDAALGLT